MINNKSIREACKKRMPLDGTDAQALEGALQQLETENEKLDVECTKRQLEIYRLERLIAGHHNASEVEKIRNGLFCPICLKEEKRLQEERESKDDHFEGHAFSG